MPVVEPQFRISTFCHAGGCVAVALGPEEVAVRCSRETDGPVLSFASGVWTTFLDDLRGAPVTGPRSAR